MSIIQILNVPIVT